MSDFDIIACYAYLGDKWAPPAHVWWPVVRWARGTFRSSALVSWTPHLVPCMQGIPHALTQCLEVGKI